MGRNYNCHTALELTNRQVSGFVFSWFHENTEKTKASSETVLRLMPLPCHMVASAVSAHLLQLQESASSADPVVPSLLVPGPVKSLYAYCSMASALALQLQLALLSFACCPLCSIYVCCPAMLQCSQLPLPVPICSAACCWTVRCSSDTWNQFPLLSRTRKIIQSQYWWIQFEVVFTDGFKLYCLH